MECLSATSGDRFSQEAMDSMDLEQVWDRILRNCSFMTLLATRMGKKEQLHFHVK